MAESRDARHLPVMKDEVVRLLDPRAAAVIVDGTVGLGGHAEAILAVAPEATLIGIDLDPEALTIAGTRLARFGDRVHLVHGNYRGVVEQLEALGIDAIDGFLVDLGLCSLQLDRAARGFSFREDGPLDMRMDPGDGPTAADLVNTVSQAELSAIVSRYGEERFALRIARAIVSARAHGPIATTGALAAIVRDAIPRKFHPHRIDPATRTFQALRIAVNQELENLEAGLEAGFAALRPGGVLAAISFHSLEDRIVKGFLRHKALSCTCPPDFPVCVCDKRVEVEVLTKRPLVPDPEEVAANPRGRSAKLRAGRKLAAA